MNKQIKYIVIIILTLSFGSCNNDFLERFPLDEISEKTFWSTENDLNSYMTGLYEAINRSWEHWVLMGHSRGWTTHASSLYFLDEMSDNLTPTHSRHRFFAMIKTGKLPTVNNYHFAWEVFYGGWNWELLRMCNVFLDQYDKVDIPSSTKNAYAGEVRFLRAWFYWDKCKKFGDVPWIEEPLNIDDEQVYGVRDNREMVMDKVLEDLNFACNTLPESWNNEEPGRIDKWVALALKSRLCLYEGTRRKYHGLENANSWLQESLNASKEIMDNGPFSIYSTGNPDADYASMFPLEDVSGISEVIYWKRYRTGYLTHVLPRYMYYTGGMSKDAVEDYLCTDGLPITQSQLYAGDDMLEDVFENRDPRLRQTVLHPGDVSTVGYDLYSTRAYPRFTGMSGGYTSNSGYIIRKAYNPDHDVVTFSTGCTTAAIIFRYGEILLNYAEAKAELGGLDQSDLDISVNLLRDRVGMPPMDLGNLVVDEKYTNEGISTVLVEIRRERRVELFNEGLRYDDLMRWKKGKKLEERTLGMRWEQAQIDRYPGAIVQTYTEPTSGKTYIDIYKGTDYENPVFDENKHYLWPIPLNSLSQNPALEQNPGW